MRKESNCLTLTFTTTLNGEAFIQLETCLVIRVIGLRSPGHVDLDEENIEGLKQERTTLKNVQTEKTAFEDSKCNDKSRSHSFRNIYITFFSEIISLSRPSAFIVEIIEFLKLRVKK